MTSPIARLNRRPTAVINPKLEKNLATYIAAAGAAATAMFAAQSAEAKIVYTPANQSLNLGTRGQIPLDLNGDGIPDVYFSGGANGYSDYVGANPAAGNGIVGAPGSAAALAWGARIGPKDQFENQAELMERQSCKTYCTTQGPWGGKYNRFLGVKFQISGQTHYGWVSINMKKGTITGYAYQTVANQPILAGEKSTPVEVGATVVAPLTSSKTPATLGILARGAPGIALWRGDDVVA
jgi:hypothetical protein